MTLEEAIKHCFDVYNRLKAQDIEDCECAEEHKQLAEWLEELKERREDSTKDYNRGYADGCHDGYAGGVPKGEWIDFNPDLWQCSCCNRSVPRLYDYCPHCGADMREES